MVVWGGLDGRFETKMGRDSRTQLTYCNPFPPTDPTTTHLHTYIPTQYTHIYINNQYSCTPTHPPTHKTQAAEVNLVGCQFGPKDAALWKKTGQMFLELGRPFYLKATYCFGRAVKVC